MIQRDLLNQKPYLLIGVILSVVYVSAVALVPVFLGIAPSDVNEWGDYFAGFLSPLALSWFIATLMLQRRELMYQRNELKLTREVLKEQGDQQEKIAAANLEANQIAASNAFVSLVPKYREGLEQRSFHMRGYLTALLNGHEYSDVIYAPTSTDGSEANKLIKFVQVNSVDLMSKNYVDIHQNIDGVERNFTEFLKIMDEFTRRAVETDNAVLIEKPYCSVMQVIRVLNVGVEDPDIRERDTA